VVTCDSGETSTTVLDGFTITNGANNFGGGMHNNYNSSPTVSNCIFTGNTADDYGGGMYNNNDSSPTVSNCTFSGNTTDYNGGGMYNYNNSSPTVTNCTFSGNTANNTGGGMRNFSSSSPTVTNCILWGNSPNEILNNASTPTVSFSNLQGGLPGGTIDGGGNISVDPLFVDADGPDNTIGTEDDNLRLLDGSPCIDAGDTSVPSLATFTTDLDGNHRALDDPATPNTGVTVVGITVDMGAYEFYFSPAPCISQLEGDINCDGIVNLLDLSLLALHWLETI
jgi:parallel beta-helix repeat protein